LRAARAEACLLSANLNAAAIAQAKFELAKDLDPFDDIHATAATKRYLAGVLLQRVVRTLVK